jgi:GNAT superfamily N-acetyltransferase
LVKKYTARRYRKGDEEQIVPLLQKVFPNWPRADEECSPMDFWKWRYQNNPFQNNIAIIAESNEEIIGCSHSYVIKCKIDGKMRDLHIAGDLVVHPDFRRMGVSSRLSEIKKKMQVETNIFASLQVSTNPIVIQSALKKGRPTFPQPIKKMVHISDTVLHSKQKNVGLHKRIGYDLLSTYNKTSKKVRPNNNDDYKLKEISEFKQADDFWNQIMNNYAYVMVRDNKFMNWRYSPKIMGYHIIQVNTDAGMAGFCVLKINGDKEYPQGIIVDFLTTPNHTDLGFTLLEEALRFFNEKGVNYCTSWLISGHPYVDVFEKMGFVQTKNNVAIHFNPKTSEPVFAGSDYSPHKLVFSMGDTDIN